MGSEPGPGCELVTKSEQGSSEDTPGRALRHPRTPKSQNKQCRPLFFSPGQVCTSNGFFKSSKLGLPAPRGGSEE